MQGENYQAPPGPPPNQAANPFEEHHPNYQQQGYVQQQQGYVQQPPNYGQNYGPGPNHGYAYQGQGDKPEFTQAFKLNKPKFNDLWAGILVSP